MWTIDAVKVTGNRRQNMRDRLTLGNYYVYHQSTSHSEFRRRALYSLRSMAFGLYCDAPHDISALKMNLQDDVRYMMRYADAPDTSVANIVEFNYLNILFCYLRAHVLRDFLEYHGVNVPAYLPEKFYVAFIRVAKARKMYVND